MDRLNSAINTILILALLSIGASPIALNTWERYTRIPILDEGHEVAVTTSSAPVLNDTGSYTDERDLWLFEWGTAVSVECVLRACFCLAMDDDSISIGSGATCGDIADTNATVPDSTGGNACFAVPAGGRIEFLVDRVRWGSGAISATSKSGYRTGYCSQADGNTGYPCDAADDCLTAAGGAGTCTDAAAGASLPSVTGLFMISEAAANTSCNVRKDR